MLISSRMISGAVSLPPIVKTFAWESGGIRAGVVRNSRRPTRSRSIRACVTVPFMSTSLPFLSNPQI